MGDKKKISADEMTFQCLSSYLTVTDKLYASGKKKDRLKCLVKWTLSDNLMLHRSFKLHNLSIRSTKEERWCNICHHFRGCNDMNENVDELFQDISKKGDEGILYLNTTIFQAFHHISGFVRRALSEYSNLIQSLP